MIYNNIHEFHLPRIPQRDPIKDYTGIIYKITNILDNKSYIGKSGRSFHRRYVSGRWWDVTHNIELKQDYVRLGKDAFEIEILEHGLSNEDQSILEQLFIKVYDALRPNGYNVMASGRTITEEHKRNIGLANVGKHSHQLKGRPLSEEHKKKISAGHHGRIMSEQERYIRTIGQMGALHPQAKAVLQIDKNTGVVIHEYDCAATAGKTLGIDDGAIGMVCKGKRQTCGGYKWTYKDTYETP